MTTKPHLSPLYRVSSSTSFLMAILSHGKQFLSCHRGNIQRKSHRRLILPPASRLVVPLLGLRRPPTALCLIAVDKRGWREQSSHTAFPMTLSIPLNKMTLLVFECLIEVTAALTHSHERAGTRTHLVDEHLRPPGTHEQHGPPQCVPVAVELLRAHGAE